MSFFYTCKGDKGKSCVGGKRISKDSPASESLGALDELNSLLGLIRSQRVSSDFKNILKNIQENLFIIQANVAKLVFGKNLKTPSFSKNEVLKMERLIDSFEKEIKLERGFVVSGENDISAWLDYARAVARRVERHTVKIKKVKPEILAYLNRLSSLLFVLARVVSKRAKVKERHPSYNN